VKKGSEELIRASGYSDEGFAATYDANRLAPPSTLLDVLVLSAGVDRPELVVDLGSGTGLSTRVWADRAQEVVGVEPNEAMRTQAEARTREWNVRYVDAYANATGLPDAAADVVTCSQSFHWMEPEATLAEAARILRAGGVFAAYDYELPPVIHPEVDAAFERWLTRRREIREHLRMSVARKAEHLHRIEASGAFTYVREVFLHGRTEGGAPRVVGLARSIGPPLDEARPQLDQLQRVAERVLGDRVVPWIVPYRVRIGVR
jgi:ubiquinone/menaquinone biosynthesis C-methylase UbiE